MTRGAAEELLDALGHRAGAAWLSNRIADGDLPLSGDPPILSGDDLWRALLADECGKLYNQAWCAAGRLDEEGAEADLMLGIDELPSAVEQAWSLSPDDAGEHLDLLKAHRPERHENLCRELAIGTERETAERIECLAFWEANGEDLSPLRRRLFTLVREALSRGE
jgi:hypothetical protein